MNTEPRAHRAAPVLVTILSLALVVGACDPNSRSSQPAAGGEPASNQANAQNEGAPSAGNERNAAKGRSFATSAGTVTVRRAGFDTLRIVDVTAKSGWRRDVEDDLDESVAVEFFMGRRSLDFNAALENGRLIAEACRDISRLSARPAIGDAATVALRRIGDEDLRVSIVRTSRGWRGRITDNNSEDVEVVFSSGQGKLEFDAQLDDGRLEGTICRVLA